MKNSKTLELTFTALFAALIVICSWISIPATISFTLQTFAVFLAAGLLGGKRATLSVIIYVLLGAVGLPVFTGFKGGLGALLGTTGGYIIGFIFTALVMWLFEIIFREKFSNPFILALSMIAGLLVCYAFGTAWFVNVYTRTKGPVGIMAALSWCVFPFIIPDLIKIGLALTLTLKLRKFIPFNK